MPKTYVLEARQIRALAPGRGACIASDKITVLGERVGYMYRETPVETSDSGWRFLSGTETDEYMNDPNNSGLFDVNTISNYDTEIIEFLDAPVGSAFVRQTPGAPLRPYVIEAAPEPEPILSPTFAPARNPLETRAPAPATAREAAPPPPPAPVAPPPPPAPAVPPTLVRSVPVRRDLTAEWSIVIEPEFKARLVDGDLQFVEPRPPVRTLWISVWGMPDDPTPEDSPEALLAEFRSAANPAAVEVLDEPGADIAERRFATWYPDTVEGSKQWSLYGYTIRPEGWVQSAFIVDDPRDLDWARDTWRSLRYAPAK